MAQLLASLIRRTGILLALALAGSALPASGHAAVEGEDALQRRVLAQLSNFTGWLERHGEQGFVGEVGWPDTPEWNALADRWYRAADEAGLWVTAWSTGEWWGTSYPLSIYEDRLPGAGVDFASGQAAVIEAHPGPAGVLRGVNVAGGEFAAPSVDATSAFSNASPGVYDRAYHYDSQQTFDYLAGRGVELVRIPFRWERLQPRLGKPLDPEELARLKAVVARAGAAGLRVVLDMHNYGGYYLFDGTRGVRRAIGSLRVPIWRFAEIWGRISNHFRRDPAVIGYGLMNEPVDLAASKGRTPAQTWFEASQAALRRIRSHGDRKLVLVAGYEWSGAQRWSEVNPAPWINDPAGNYRYEAHHYFDLDSSGTYVRSYAEELAAAHSRGY